MEEEKGNTQKTRLAPCLDAALNFISKNRCASVDVDSTESKYFTLNDAHTASRLSQLFHINRLTAKHLNSIRLLSTSKAVQADQELEQMLLITPEMRDFNMGSEDPGLHYLSKVGLDGNGAIASNEKIIHLESIEAWREIFRNMNEYSFYKVRKKTMQQEFSVAENAMREMVERYGLVGRFSWNKSSSKSKHSTPKLDRSFLNKYKNTSAS